LETTLAVSELPWRSTAGVVVQKVRGDAWSVTYRMNMTVRMHVADSHLAVHDSLEDYELR
jgi:hypothetical protein